MASLSNRTILIALSCILSSLVAHLQQPARAQTFSNSGDDGPFYRGPGVMPSQIFRALGYRVEDHYIRSEDGYQILITRALNPLINNGTRGANNRIPILFVHGILESFNVFVINSFDATPKDFSNRSLTSLSLEEAQSMYGNEKSAKTLPTLALNHGHEVWIMSRRSFPGSQDKLGNPVKGFSGAKGNFRVTGPTTALAGGLLDYGLLAEQIAFSANIPFFNFSMDQQAAYDLPSTVEHVLNVTNWKHLSLVSHSAGGAITLMALAELPEMNQKLNSAIFWAQAFSVGHGLVGALTPLRPVLELYTGAFPPVFLADQLQAIFTVTCSTGLTASLLCETVGDLLLGPSGGQAPLSAELLASLFYGTPSHELAQFLQCVTQGFLVHHYDYGPLGNLAAYNQTMPPPYNLGQITLDRMSFYMGTTDNFVTLADNEAVLEQLRVPYRRHVLSAPFNHLGYFYNRGNARKVIIPSLREIHEFSEA